MLVFPTQDMLSVIDEGGKDTEELSGKSDYVLGPERKTSFWRGNDLDREVCPCDGTCLTGREYSRTIHTQHQMRHETGVIIFFKINL